MRIKTLLKYHIFTGKYAVTIFFAFFMIGTILSSFLSSFSGGSIGVTTVTDPNGGTQTWSASIISFAIFIIIVSIIGSKQDTRFLITRSVSRKEIVFSNILYFIPLSAFMSLFLMFSVYLDAFLRAILTGGNNRGLELEILSHQAPNMTNLFVFSIVTFTLLLSFCAIGYLIGSCSARWRMQTIGVLLIAGIALISCLALPNIMNHIYKFFKFLFYDEKNGLFIAGKQLLLACIMFTATFPVARKITAAKQ